MPVHSIPGLKISTHALTEGDRNRIRNLIRSLFQLTPSRRATTLKTLEPDSESISTHALTEGDTLRISVRFSICRFQLTPSRRATDADTVLNTAKSISTHALTEGDCNASP